MTIDYTGINVNFPVAGQDNDSQTFRDNYSAIYTAFAQTDGVLTNLSTSTARLNTTNEFQGNTIQHAVLQNIVTEANLANDQQSQDPYVVYFNQAGFHEINNVTTATFKVNSWPNSTDWESSGYYANLRLKVSPDATKVGVLNNGAWGQSSVNFASMITGGTIWSDTGTWKTAYSTSTQFPYVTTSTNTQIWDVWTVNGGQDTFVTLLGIYKHS